MAGQQQLGRVAVVGGGIAGVSAALELAAAGATVTLLESRGRLGGAAFSFPRGELSVDNGQHVFLRCTSAYRAFIERIAATDLVHTQSRLSIPVLAPGRAVAWLQRDGLPAPLHLARSLLRYPYLSASERVSVVAAMAALARVDPDSPAADADSFGEWLRSRRQSANAIEVLWDLIATPTLNLRADEASLAQAAFVFQQGLLRDPHGGDVGYAVAPLGEIHDVRARTALDRAGVSVRLRAGVRTICARENGYELAISSAPRLSVDAVVLATGPTRTRQLLPAAAGIDPAQIDALSSSPIVNLHVILDRRVMAADFAATVRSPVQWIFDRTASSGLERGQYLAISLSAADAELHMGVGQLRERFLPALAAVLPSMEAAQVEDFFVTREHAATFRAAPGQRALRPRARTTLEGFALAGAWTDTGWPATMEGAVRSGHAAAAETLAWLRRRPVTGRAHACAA